MKLILSKFRVFALMSLILVQACGNTEAIDDEVSAYAKSVETWHEERIDELVGEKGWLGLAGLYWLNPGENTFGTSRENAIVFPQGFEGDGTNSVVGARHMGSFFLADTTVTIDVSGEVAITYLDKPVRSMQLYPSTGDTTVYLETGTFRWHVIERDGRFAVRLRDLASKNIDGFSGIDRYPVDPAWAVTATLKPYGTPKEMTVPTIMGTNSQQTSPGLLSFEIGGEVYTLDPIGELSDDELFVIFTDATTGLTTYGAGRYVWIQAPDENGRTVIDFNKAYNPPCAFTAYATCPLPPPQNKLALKIEAGEKNYHLAMH